MPDVLPKPTFAVGDHVKVIRPGADQGLTGKVVAVLPLNQRVVVEFNTVIQQVYKEEDLAIASGPV
jgi:ribosomal protein L24